MTTFTSRELVRDALVTIFKASAKGANQFKEIYGYAPSANEILASSPLLVIRGTGTLQEMNMQETNPTRYRLVLSVMVRSYDDSVTPALDSAWAEDKIDDLDRLVRQIIRNNTQNAAWNTMDFDEEFSQKDDVIVGKGVPYIIESRSVIIKLPIGSV